MTNSILGLHEYTPLVTPVPDLANVPSHDDIARLAHRLWEERGCPEGSPDEDWLRAEALLQDSDR